MRSDPEVQQMADTWQLGLPRMPVSGRAGELLGRGTGSSLEFQEHREYLPGDDIRHLDWAAYARADTLMLRMYREEISPRTEIFLDCSRSMLTSPPNATAAVSVKSVVARQLAGLCVLLAARLGGRPQLTLIDDHTPLRRLELESLEELRNLDFSGLRPLSQAVAENLIPPARQSVRIVISDFLFPHDAEPMIRRLATGCSALWVLQTLHAWEADPKPLGGRRLIDVESGTESDLVLDEATIRGYQERFGRMQAELSRNCRRMHARFVPIIVDGGLASVCRGPLAQSELIRPA